MSTETDAPFDGSAAGEPKGQAAILLVEALIHALIARQQIGVADAVEIVEAAIEVGMDLESESALVAPGLRRPTEILSAIADSLKLDLPDGR